jgi:hypothetical protein
MSKVYRPILMTRHHAICALQERRPKLLAKVLVETKLAHRAMNHGTKHLVAMGDLHRAGRYDRLADGVERVTGQSAMIVREVVSGHIEEFGGRGS